MELLHQIKAQLQPHLEALKREIRASPAVQADETGWREDGINGYVWSVWAPDIRYFEYHHSRGGEVVKALIGKDFGGVLGSDFYAGYNSHEGLHQRPYVNGLSAFCPSSLSLSRCPRFQLTTIWPSAAFVPWLLLAKSVEGHEAPKVQRPAWDSPVSLAPG